MERGPAARGPAGDRHRPALARHRRRSRGRRSVVEIRSPGDETYEKIEFYAAAGVRELLVVHPDDRRAEVFRAVGSRLLPVQAPGGVLGLETLRVELRTTAGALHLTWDDGSAQV
ncbi:Uma2 family endonuclease [Pseudonocardia sp. NPDC046786]|uniref:Uma2 family endonuclease n=1 Tax=Pseudonocardia sp. NPDC046786 TaxID=3155471 RepID=UPI0033F0882F